MKHYRISIDVDIKARDEEQARRRANLIYSDIEGARPWIVEILPIGMEERIPLK
jgi:predicted glycosyltransferase